MVAGKYLYDEGIDEEVVNSEWAEAGCLDTDDVNQIEREFLRAIDWSLFTKPEEFEDALCRLENRYNTCSVILWFRYSVQIIFSAHSTLFVLAQCSITLLYTCTVGDCRIATKEALGRGFWTFTDLSVRLEDVKLTTAFNRLLKDFCKVRVHAL